MDSFGNYLLLVSGNNYRDYRYCGTAVEVRSIIESENTRNYDVFRRIGDVDKTFQLILKVEEGNPCHGFDTSLIPDSLKDLI